MPLPPARVSAMNASRHSRGSRSVCWARPPATPPIIFSVPLRVRPGRGVDGVEGPGTGSEVMPPRCPRLPASPIGESPEPTLVLHTPSTPGDHRCAAGGGGDTIDAVTTSATPPAGPAAGLPGRPARPPLVRPRNGRRLAGVAQGTAAHLRLHPSVVRVVFVGLALTGIGVVAYALLWLTMPVADTTEDAAEVGVVGQRPSRRQLLGLAVLAFVTFGVVSRLASFGGVDVLVPLLLAGAGVAVIWRQIDADATLARGPARWGLAGGVALGVSGVVLLLVTSGQLANARNGFTATVV